MVVRAGLLAPGCWRLVVRAGFFADEFFAAATALFRARRFARTVFGVEFRMPFPTRFLPAALVAFGLAVGIAAAAPTGAQRAELAAVGTLLTRAGYLYNDSKFKEAGDLVKEFQTRLDKLAEGADAQLFSNLQGIHRRLVNAHALLELEGVTLP
jgi:hypothetical protein